jgi:acetylornithine deacetylase/succinyl-diaminopimelate desuccinylase-like protein
MAEEAQGELIELLCELIRFPTVNTGVMPTGNELPLCEFVQRKLAVEGIESQIVKSAENRGNLIARLPGSTGRPRLLFMGHTDVVPVDAGEWNHPPFAGAVADGRVWGRGAADMKDLVAAELMALILLKRSSVRLVGDLIVAACADEETGGQYGFGWLAQHAPELLRADYAINEGGGAPLPTDQGLAYAVPVGEKGRLEVRITFRGRATHAASPWQGDNVALKLGEALRRMAAYRAELDVSHPFFDRVRPLIGRDDPITVENVDAVAAEVEGKNPGLASALRGLSRMTLTPTMFSGGVKSNSVPAVCGLTCDVRTLLHQDEAYVRRQLDGILQGIDGASYDILYTAVPSSSPAATPLFAALERTLCTVTGREDVQVLPSLTIGFTDSRLVRPLGPIIYAFSPGHPDVDPKILSNAHGANESTDVRSVLFRAQALLALAVDLLGEA